MDISFYVERTENSPVWNKLIMKFELPEREPSSIKKKDSKKINNP